MVFCCSAPLWQLLVNTQILDTSAFKFTTWKTSGCCVPECTPRWLHSRICTFQNLTSSGRKAKKPNALSPFELRTIAQMIWVVSLDGTLKKKGGLGGLTCDMNRKKNRSYTSPPQMDSCCVWLCGICNWAQTFSHASARRREWMSEVGLLMLVSGYTTETVLSAKHTWLSLLTGHTAYFSFWFQKER